MCCDVFVALPVIHVRSSNKSCGGVEILPGGQTLPQTSLRGYKQTVPYSRITSQAGVYHEATRSDRQMRRAIVLAHKGSLHQLCNTVCAQRARFSVTAPRAKPELSTRANVLTTISASSNRVELRPYQEDSIQAVLRYLANGEKRLGISLATGSGKTVALSHEMPMHTGLTPSR